MNVVALFRVSTDQQADSALGLEAQRQDVEALCAREGMHVVAEHIEAGVSGRKALEAREGLVRALADVSLHGAQALVVAGLDRVSRDPLVLMMVEKLLAGKSARLISAKGEGTASDDPSQILMRRILSAVAENEAMMISVRTKSALRAKKARGEITGRPPMGFDLHEGQLVPNEDFHLVEKILKMRNRKVTLREISNIMNTFAPGRAWSEVKVHRIVKRWGSLRSFRRAFPKI
jgi:site-specific DNA recombinase